MDQESFSRYIWGVVVIEVDRQGLFVEFGPKEIQIPGSIERLLSNVVPSQASVIKLNDAGN